MHGTLASLVSSYGYALLFVLVGVESFGIPLPGETALVTAGAFAATGRLDLIGVIAAAAAGAIVGDNAGYWVGRKGGIALVRRYGRHVGLDERKLNRVRAFFDRHGAKTVFIGRFIALLRSWAAALAGVARMSYRTFTIYNALGGIVWAAIFGALGFMFGRNLPRLERYIGQASLALALLAVLVVLLVFGGRWFRRHREGVSAGVWAFWQRGANSARLSALRRRHGRLYDFATVRFSREEYLALHLIAGMLVSLAALRLFGGITEDVIHNDPLTQFDLGVASWFHEHRSPLAFNIASAVSAMGSPIGTALLAIVVALFLAFRRHWIMLAGWVAALAGTGLLGWVLKVVIRRPRPVGAAAFLHGSGFPFPSGHAMASLIGFGMLTYVLLTYWPAARRHAAFVVTIAAVLVLAVGLSRLYLGEHYFSDVVGGYAAGLVWLASCISGIEIAARSRLGSSNT